MDWLLTQAEAEKAVEEWVKEDWATNSIALNRGHWERIVPVLAQAQLRKVTEKLSKLGIDNEFSHENWQALLKEAGMEEGEG